MSSRPAWAVSKKKPVFRSGAKNVQEKPEYMVILEGKEEM
jgi:hypothetical protein